MDLSWHAGSHGGYVFVLESQPWHRVGHLHVVDREGSQWRDYLRLRDLLRHSPEARQHYEAVKVSLSQQADIDRETYTLCKTEVVASLLRTLE